MIPLALPLLGACAESATTVLAPYQLANGRVLQDVVSVASDASGGAPVLTSLTTYDVSHAAGTVVIARESASAPGVGLAMADGLGSAAMTSAAILSASAIAAGECNGDTVVDARHGTDGNSATDGDAGDIDTITAVVGNCGSAGSASN
ncbi:hypothetical protein [Citreimonas salinaria]|nr:hypothetical protein [Citreimonas salinaria]